MRAWLQNHIKDNLTRAAFLCAALVLLVYLLPPFDLSTVPAPSPTPASDGPAPVAVFFGDSGDPLCGPLYAALGDFAQEQSWRLITYDCKGSATSQRGQLADFLRQETADLAVVYSRLEQGELDEQVEALYNVTKRVVTIGQPASSSASRYVAAHISAANAPLEGAADYFKKTLKGGGDILLLPDLPDPDWETACAAAFADSGVTIVDHGYTWTGEVYAQRYLETALEAFPEAKGILCTSRAGTVGAWNTLEEKGLTGKVKIVSLSYDTAIGDDLALGRLDAAVTLSPQEAAATLKEVLPMVLEGKRVGAKALAPVLLTPGNLDEMEF